MKGITIFFGIKLEDRSYVHKAFYYREIFFRKIPSKFKNHVMPF